MGVEAEGRGLGFLFTGPTGRAKRVPNERVRVLRVCAGELGGGGQPERGCGKEGEGGGRWAPRSCVGAVYAVSHATCAPFALCSRVLIE
jgi:hypothetical protein